MTKPSQVTWRPIAPCWARRTFSVCSFGFFDNYAILFLYSSGNRSTLGYIELVFHTGTSLPIEFSKTKGGIWAYQNWSICAENAPITSTFTVVQRSSTSGPCMPSAARQLSSHWFYKTWEPSKLLCRSSKEYSWDTLLQDMGRGRVLLVPLTISY